MITSPYVLLETVFVNSSSYLSLVALVTATIAEITRDLFIFIVNCDYYAHLNSTKFHE